MKFFIRWIAWQMRKCDSCSSVVSDIRDSSADPTVYQLYCEECSIHFSMCICCGDIVQHDACVYCGYLRVSPELAVFLGEATGQSCSWTQLLELYARSSKVENLLDSRQTELSRLQERVEEGSSGDSVSTRDCMAEGIIRDSQIEAIKEELGLLEEYLNSPPIPSFQYTALNSEVLLV